MPWSLSFAPLAARQREFVLGCAAVLIALQLGFRAWALYPSWFYLDDFLLIEDAPSTLSGGYVFGPHDSQLMPLGRVVAWLVASTGPMNWTLAATLTLVGQAAAGAACCWCLATLFGMRPGILLPLGIYLTSAMTMPSTMWWAASLNAVPLQIAFFCSIACWFRYLRSRRARWLALTLIAVALGLSAYVKALLLLPFLGGLAVAYFAEGTLWTRVRMVLHRDRWAVGAGIATGAAYLAYYVTHVPQLATTSPLPLAGPLAQEMLGEALVVGLVGGPWRWDDINPPVGLASPPGWAIVAAWIAVLAAAAYWTLRRHRTGRAWLLFAGYALASYLLLLFTRVAAVGPIAGLEYRYLSDVTCAWVLALGLISMRLVDSDQGSAPRAEPLLGIEITRRAGMVLALAVIVFGVISSVRYVDPWHTGNDAEHYFTNAEAALDGAGQVDLANEVVPDRVMPGFLHPRNRQAVLLPLMVDNVRFPDTTSDLVVLDQLGLPHHAIIDSVARTPVGPDGACGWRVTSAGREIALETPVSDGDWWLRIGYLAASDDRIEVTVADTTTPMPVRQGLHSLFIRPSGPVSTVRITGVDPDNALCVDIAEVGRPVPGAPL